MIVKKDHKRYFNFLIELKKDFKIRESVNYAEIVSPNGKKVISTKNKSFSKGLFLFSMVKRNIKAYISLNGYVEPADKLPVNFTNENFDKKKIDSVIGIDIDNAYWSVAYLKGYIEENTYKKGLEDREFKPIRLSALSTLGKGKNYKVYKSGIYTNDELVNVDSELENFYLDIRYSTYGVLLEISKELKNDFYCWKTDAIFFIDTLKNRELVRKRLIAYGLNSKIELLK